MGRTPRASARRMTSGPSAPGLSHTAGTFFSARSSITVTPTSGWTYNVASSMGPGYSRTVRYARSPSTVSSCGLTGTTVYPCRRNARSALFPNFRRSFDAPMTAMTGMDSEYDRYDGYDRYDRYDRSQEPEFLSSFLFFQ